MKSFIIETNDGEPPMQVNADRFVCGANMVEFFIEGQSKPIAVVYRPSTVYEKGKVYGVAPEPTQNAA